MYALCTKTVDGRVVYLGRRLTDKYNSSKLELPMPIFYLGPIDDGTLIASSDDWKLFLDEATFKQIASQVRNTDAEVNFSHARFAFAKVSKVVTYDTTICVPFILTSEGNDYDRRNIKADINWDAFC